MKRYKLENSIQDSKHEILDRRTQLSSYHDRVEVKNVTQPVSKDEEAREERGQNKERDDARM